MSQLGQLKIVGTLSPCNKTVRIQNQMVNANVILTMKPPTGAAIPIGGGQATWPDESFTFTQPLVQGHTLIAVQMLSGFTPSADATSPIGKPPTPADLAKGTFAFPIHTCAKCVYLYGLWPGAVCEIRTSLGEAIGKAVVPEDGVTPVYLVRELHGGEFLQAFLSCGSVSGSSPIFAGSGSVRPPAPLPPPTIDPAIECDHFITVSGIVPGAQVTVFRGGGQLGPACSPSGRLKFVGIKPLRKPDDNTIQALQAFPHDLCRLESPKGSTSLQDRKKIPAPTIGQPLCEGATSIPLSGLREGAMVELTVNGATLVFGAASTAPPPFPVAPLTMPQTVTARQNTCGDPASWSALAKAPVNSSKPVPPKPYSPVNGATGVAPNPMLRWTDPGTFCNMAASFQFQVATDQNFASVVFTVNGVTGLQWSIWPPLLPSTTYFWRVRSHRSALTTAWSGVMKFTTVKKDQKPTDKPGIPPDTDVRRDRCFIEDCCAVNGGRRVVKAYGTYNEAYAKCDSQKASGCSIGPLEVPCNTRAKPCSEP